MQDILDLPTKTTQLGPGGVITISGNQVVIDVDPNSNHPPYCFIIAGFMGPFQMDIQIASNPVQDFPPISSCSGCNVQERKWINKNMFTQRFILTPVILSNRCGNPPGTELLLVMDRAFLDDHNILTVSYKADDGTSQGSITLVVQVGVDP